MCKYTLLHAQPYRVWQGDWNFSHRGCDAYVARLQGARIRQSSLVLNYYDTTQSVTGSIRQLLVLYVYM
jgi:hypothetical protein